MKILKLKFKNINSLADVHEIDFSERGFADHGIFAITGKTGAGKSSILDAISLALYGKTPRVKEITRDNNDVMTRGTNDCFSEVLFEVGGKQWKSSWKQERTRTGSLKSIQRQIANGMDEIVAEKVNECNSKIAEILGLTFEQFTKVVMLAQGSFAAFLLANKNEKGELLEQITGTEIYGGISQKVFERNKTEKDKLDRIHNELGAITILSEEEITLLNIEITECEKRKGQVDAELKTIEATRQWLVDLENLQKQISEAKHKLPDLEQNVEAAKTAFEQAETTLKSAKTDQTEAAHLWGRVRQWDTQLAEKENRLNPLRQAIGRLEETKEQLSQTLDNLNKDLGNSRIKLKERRDWVTANAKYESLEENYAVMEDQHSQAIALCKDFEIKNGDFETAKNELATRNSDFQNSQEYFAERENEFNRKTQEFETRKTELSTILAGKELADHQTEKENTVRLEMQIGSLMDVEKEISKNLEEIENHKNSLVTSEESVKELSEKITENESTAEHLDRQIRLLDENIKLAKTIQSLEEHRKSLEDGKACPLCGATEHPYARGNEPKIGEAETELITLKKQLQEINNALRQDETTVAGLISNQENSSNNKKKAETNLSENREKQKNILSEIKTFHPDFYIPDSENRITLLEEICGQKRSERRHIEKIISDATEIERLIKKLQNEEIPKLQDAKQTAQEEKTKAETAWKLANERLKNKRDVSDEAETKYKEKNAELLRKFAEYGVDNIAALKNCFTDWNTNKKAIEEWKEKIAKGEKTLALTDSEKTAVQIQIEDKTTEKHSIETEKQTLVRERYDLFGDKRVEDEEKRLSELLKNAESVKTEQEQFKTIADTELEKNKAVIADKEKERSEKQAKRMTEKTLEELQNEWEERKKQSDELSQQIGANRQNLNTDDKSRKNHGKKLQAKEWQQETCRKWASLNELIGSADGKKYRNFAQALTFEHLIGLTNIQLQKMSERYLLKRVGDAANPFELSVIDKFQNCDERTAQNLSGGETFIVSLSLALGLANMASQNMKIDTMFIDEGFGTLDSDYLDVALSALSNLQNEGKLIGVISHLTELKERIASHIDVVPGGNGYSKIECR